MTKIPLCLPGYCMATNKENHNSVTLMPQKSYSRLK